MMPGASSNSAGENAAPLVSIVIPAYNHAAFLDEAIKSVLAQDYPQVELIVLDDGSTDGTTDILRRYSEQFHWESHHNMGQAATLNKGFGMACGEILSYLSADDALLPGAVTAAVDALTAIPDAVACYGDFNLVDPNSRIIRRVRTPEFSYFDLAVRGVCAPGPGAFFRRSAYSTAGPWNPALRQIPDYEFWLRLGLQGRFLRIPRVLAAFRVHDSSLSFTPSDESRSEEPVGVLQSYFDSPCVPLEISDAKKQALSNAHFLSGRLHIRAGRFRAGFSHVGAALRLHPSNLFSPRNIRILINALVNRGAHRLWWNLRSFFARQP